MAKYTIWINSLYNFQNKVGLIHSTRQSLIRLAVVWTLDNVKFISISPNHQQSVTDCSSLCDCITQIPISHVKDSRWTNPVPKTRPSQVKNHSHEQCCQCLPDTESTVLCTTIRPNFYCICLPHFY
jgi:hypothetical protein